MQMFGATDFHRQVNGFEEGEKIPSKLVDKIQWRTLIKQNDTELAFFI